MKNLFIASILLFSFSCKKEEKTLVYPPSEIIVGNPSSVYITNVNPTISLYSYNATLSKSIDIDGDSREDFKLTTSHGASCAGGSYHVDSKIETLTEGSFILADSVYTFSDHDYTNNVITQTSVYEFYPKIFDLNEQIKINSQWSKGVLKIASEGGSNITCGGNNHFVRMENWYGQTNKYIAVRCGNILGWIKVSLNNSGITILEYARSHI